MENTTIIFQNEEGSKKATVTIKPSESALEVKLDFEPSIEAKQKPETYAYLALEFVKFISQ